MTFRFLLREKKVPGKSEAEVKSALMAMVSNKKGVPADQEKDDDPLFG